MIRIVFVLAIASVVAVPAEARARQLTGAAPASMTARDGSEPPDRTATRAKRGLDQRPWQVGIEVGYVRYGKLESVACAPQPGMSMCKVDDAGITPRLFVEYGITDNVAAGLGLSRGYFGAWQFYRTRGLDFDIAAWSFDMYSQWRLPGTGSFEPFTELGFTYILNRFDFSDPLAVAGPDTQSGLRLNVGGGFDWRLTDDYSTRFGYNYISGGSNDADTQHRFAFGITRKF